MQAKTRVWLIVRIGLVVASAVVPWIQGVPQDPDYVHPAPYYFPLMLAAITVLGISFVLAMNGLNGKRDAWSRPSWLRCPFRADQPLDFFHFAAWCMISYAAGCFISSLGADSPNWFWEIPLAVGVGMWLGIRLNFPRRSDADQST